MDILYEWGKRGTKMGAGKEGKWRGEKERVDRK